ncbi:Uncharacterised protein g1468 [Pycnogonum litorale]
MVLREWLTKKHERLKKKPTTCVDEESVLTDDPLSTLAYPSRSDVNLRKIDHIYAVSRVNPIFDDSDDDRTNIDSVAPRESLSSGFSEVVDDETACREKTVDDSQRGSSISTPSSSKRDSPVDEEIGIEDREPPDGANVADSNVSRRHDSRKCLGLEETKSEGCDGRPSKRRNLRRTGSDVQLRNLAVRSEIGDESPRRDDPIVRPEWRESVATLRQIWDLEDRGPVVETAADNYISYDSLMMMDDDDGDIPADVDDGAGVAAQNRPDSVDRIEVLAQFESDDDDDIIDPVDDTETTSFGSYKKVSRDVSTDKRPGHERNDSKSEVPNANWSTFSRRDASPLKRKVTFADKQTDGKFLTDEILKGHHMLATRGTFTNPLILQSKLYSIKTSSSGDDRGDETNASADASGGLQNRATIVDNEIKSIMIDELYSSYTFEVQGYDALIRKTKAKKKRQRIFRIVWLATGVSLLIGFVVAITLYLKVIT